MMRPTTEPPADPDRRTLIGIGAVLALAALPRAAGAQPPSRADAAAAWAAARAIPLWPAGPPGGGFVERPVPAGGAPTFIRNVARPELRVFYPARANGSSLLVMPGGAYRFVSVANEGVDVAAAMTAHGYTVFVLVYRLPGEGWANRSDVPLQDAQRAMRVIRDHAARGGLDPAAVDAVGFSAGGHLAASLATGFAEPVYPPTDAVDALDARPRGVGLIYPVISHAAGIGHAESSRMLLGDRPDAARVARRSPALRVGADTPPAFFVHALDDTAVPAENSLIMMRAMQAAGRPVEVHLFERGGHGFGTGPAGTPAGGWLDLFAAWLATPRG
ncbi:alpha/beta hydrolase [Sphingomonas flavalba]|uniref:alpha/beta hydrolase n=1 Tax=Sphingomonas flavalba TaxID=2559804 RepID=UPI0039E111D1